MTKRNGFRAPAMLVCMLLGACASEEAVQESEREASTAAIATAAPAQMSHVDPVIARQRALEAEAAALTQEKTWGFKIGGRNEIHRCWADGGVILCEAWDVQHREWVVHCVDVTNGKQKWLLALGENRLARSPQVGRGTIAFMTENDAGLVVVDARTGSRIGSLRSKLGVVPASDAISSGSTVYVASHLSGRMAALNGADGRKGWDFRVDGTPRRAPVLTQGLSRQLLIFGTDEGQIVAIDAKSAHDSAPSNAAWTKPLNGPVSGDLTFGWIAGEEEGEGYGLIVVPCEDGWLYGIDPATGRSRWVVRSDATFRGPAKIIGNRVYATNRDRMFCIDADTGHRIWYPASTAGLSEFEKNEFFGPPEGYEHAERVLADDGTRAFFTRGHSVIMRCASSDGSIESEYAMSAFDFFMTNTVTGDLLLGTKDGYLFSFK